MTRVGYGEWRMSGSSPLASGLQVAPSVKFVFFFLRSTVQTQIHARTITHLYKHTHAHPTPMSTSERLSRFDLEIHEVGHQERLTVDGDVSSH
jgi:hypothetical protein